MGKPPKMTYTFTVELMGSDVMQVLINGSAEGISVQVPTDNAGMQLGEVTVETHSGDPYDEQLELGGPDANKFDLTNSGSVPCYLVIGSTSLAPGAYAITVTAP
jgi:hypothetical protein